MDVTWLIDAFLAAELCSAAAGSALVLSMDARTNILLGSVLGVLIVAVRRGPGSSAASRKAPPARPPCTRSTPRRRLVDDVCRS